MFCLASLLASEATLNDLNRVVNTLLNAWAMLLFNQPKKESKMSLLQQYKDQQAAQLIKLLDWAGSQTTLAKALGVSPQTVHNWLARGRISASMAIKAENVTGHFLKEQLRPDVRVWEK